MTVEDPIEFLHGHKKCIVNQRELGSDAQSFALALKAALRQDPDVILVGEMRDLETIRTALTAAETGHLVFATLHTQDAPQTIDRIIDVFPAHQQDQVRVQLVGRAAGRRDPAAAPDRRRLGARRRREVLVPTPAVRNLIREGKTHQIYSAMQTGVERRHADDGRRARRRSCAPARSPSASPSRAPRRPRSCAACSALRRPARAALGGARWPRTSSRRWTSPGRRPRARSRPTPSRSSPTSSRRAGLIVLDIADKHALQGDQARRSSSGSRPQRPDDHDPPARDDGQLGHDDPARALRARGADREQAARRRSSSTSARTSRPACRCRDALERHPKIFIAAVRRDDARRRDRRRARGVAACGSPTSSRRRTRCAARSSRRWSTRSSS